MSDLILLIGTEPEDPWEWSFSGDYGCAAKFTEKNTLQSFKAARLIVVVPGMQIITKLHALENLTQKQKRQAAGFSVEDELASTLEGTHIALDTHSERMAIICGQVLKGILNALHEAGLYPDIVCADYDSISQSESFVHAGRYIHKAGNGLGYAVESELARELMDADQNLPPSIPAGSFFQKIHTSLQSGHMPLNLLQGEFSKSGGFGISRFKRSLWLAGGVAAAFVFVNIGQGLQYAKKSKAIKTEINTLYAEIFPDAELPKNPALAVLRAQSTRHGNTGDSFVNLSSILGKSVKQVKGVKIAAIRYDKGRGELSLSIDYESFDDVERLKMAAQKNGGVFSESGTRQNSDGVSGDATLRGTP